MKKKVLLLLEHAPHYRESFLRQLGERCELTVVAKPCSMSNLIPPEERKNYYYIEEKGINIINFNYLPLELKLIINQEWDVICAGWNLHHMARYLGFLNNFIRRRIKWYWMGIFYGRNKSFIMPVIRRLFINKSDGVLAYSSVVKSRLLREGVNVDIEVFNNTQVEEKGFEFLPFNDVGDKMNLIFVGRYQKRKKINRLIELVERNKNVNLRLVGPGMPELRRIFPKVTTNDRITLHGASTGNSLREHLKWSHLVVNPGGLGLLVTIAAQYGRPIMVDRNSQEEHGPEHIIAKESDQPFINWGSPNEVDNYLSYLQRNTKVLHSLATKLYKHARSNYTIENMVEAYCKAFNIR